MITIYEEIPLWEDLQKKISYLLGEVDNSRSHVKDTWDEETPEFDCLEHMLYEVFTYTECRIQKLIREYSEHQGSEVPTFGSCLYQEV